MRTRRPNGQLVLSSRRLLAVLKHLPEDSAFKNAFREDWSEDKYVQVGILNELRIARADQAAFHQRDMEPILMKSPKQLEAEAEDAKQKMAIRGGIMAQLHRNTR